MSILDEILNTKRQELEQLRRVAPAVGSASSPRSLALALRAPGTLAVIAEIKRASPSRGLIRPDLEPVAVATAYESAGARAISVLTDERYFQGSLACLEAVRRAVSVPVLCKDFLIDPIQLEAARAAGADACLLIVAALPGDSLADMLAAVRQLGMEALVEAHDEAELDQALDAGAQVVGVNNRNLRTFETDLRVAEQLLPRIPSDRVAVAESGITGRGDLERMVAAGAHACLVGEALVRHEDPGAALAGWLDAG